VGTIVLKDGRTGQELIARSSMPPHPLWSAKVMLEEPDVVQSVHEDFIRAGARLITLNTYSTTPERLEREGARDQLDMLYTRAVDLVERARDAVGADGVKIAACLPPLHGSYRPDMSMSARDLLPAYREIVALQAERADVMLCETLSAVSEVTAAVAAARESGLPVIASVTLMDDGTARLRSGEALDRALEAMESADVIALNCSKPEVVDAQLALLAARGKPFGAYANGFTGIQALEIGGTVDALKAREDVTPEAYAGSAAGWISQGATFVGGCCEIGPGHIAALARQIEAAGHEIVGDL
jgi:S-methylmethionine-dependent homocysteine/selenocysteine methylase